MQTNFMERKPVPVYFCFDDLYQRHCTLSTTSVEGVECLKVGVCFPNSEGMMLTPELAAELWPWLKRFAENKTLNS